VDGAFVLKGSGYNRWSMNEHWLKKEIVYLVVFEQRNGSHCLFRSGSEWTGKNGRLLRTSN